LPVALKPKKQCKNSIRKDNGGKNNHTEVTTATFNAQNFSHAMREFSTSRGFEWVIFTTTKNDYHDLFQTPPKNDFNGGINRGGYK